MLIGYHGTPAAFEKFQRSERGSFGSGIYFGDETLARIYSEAGDNGRVIKCKLHLKNPFVYYAADNYDYDLDSYAVNLVLELYEKQMAEAMIEASRQGDGLFGDEIRSMLVEMGHDGIVVVYRLDGSFEYVAFDPESVEVLDEDYASSHGANDLVQWFDHGQYAHASDWQPHAMTAIANTVNYFRIKQSKLGEGQRVTKETRRILTNLLQLLATDPEAKDLDKFYLQLCATSAHDLVNEWWATTQTSAGRVAVGVMNDLRVALCVIEHGCEAAVSQLPIQLDREQDLLAA